MADVQIAEVLHFLREPGGDQGTCVAGLAASVSSWMAMFAMVAEFRSKTEKRIAISAEQRRYLMDHRRPPAHWKIWVGHFERKQLKGVYFHNVLPIHKRLGDKPTTADGYPLPNTQTTSTVVGKLYAHMISTAGPGIVERQRITTAPVVQIWPITRSPVGWPRRSLTDDEVEQISMAFFRGAERRWNRVANISAGMR